MLGLRVYGLRVKVALSGNRMLYYTACMCVYIYIYTCIKTYIYIYTHIHLYIYIYTHSYILIHIYIHTYTFTLVLYSKTYVILYSTI